MDSREILDFLDAHDYDVRKTHDARWIDQKCTIDVVCLVADCIIEFTDGSSDKEFTVKDIWFNQYTVDNVQQIFSKPNPAKQALREYDKYFGQPIKLLDAAGIICADRAGRGKKYRVIHKELLEYISLRDRNCYEFLCLYIEKVLKDSGIFCLFERFFAAQDKNSFKDLKDGFVNFTIKNTPINGATECGRIFTKVLNPLACKYKKLGTQRGYISKDVITWDMLMYNQRNWRDVIAEKPKSVPRVEFKVGLPDQREDNITAYRINKAKKNLRKFNDRYRNGKTELCEKGHSEDLATQMHHIFSVSEHPEIADYLENLIALTPTQHFLYAHPNNNTSYIDKAYQYLCLVAKTGSIRDNITQKRNEPVIYSFSLYQTVLNCGLNTDEFFEVEDLDFDGLLVRIEKYY